MELKRVIFRVRWLTVPTSCHGFMELNRERARIIFFFFSWKLSIVSHSYSRICVRSRCVFGYIKCIFFCDFCVSKIRTWKISAREWRNCKWFFRFWGFDVFFFGTNWFSPYPHLPALIRDTRWHFESLENFQEVQNFVCQSRKNHSTWIWYPHQLSDWNFNVVTLFSTIIFCRVVFTIN